MEPGKRRILADACGTAVLLALLLADVLSGDSHLDLFHLSASQAVIFWKLRLPRALTALMAGAALSLSGLQMQSVFRNPLADPHIMGVSSGASLCAALVTATFPAAFLGTAMSGISIALAAFAGSILVTALIVAVSSRVGNANSLLILGVMTGYVLSALTSVVEYSSSDRALRLFYNWSSGSFTSASWGQLGMMLAMGLTGLLICLVNLRGLDVLLFGDVYARSTGSDVKSIRRSSMLSCCLLTSAVTAFCGPLGFVGIAGPHIARWIWGTSVHRRIVLASMISGSSIALIADILSVNLPLAVPVGSAMAVVGIPVVLFIIIGNLRNEH